MPETEALDTGIHENLPNFATASRQFLHRETTFVPISINSNDKQFHLFRTKTMDIDYSTKPRNFKLIRHRTMDFDNNSRKSSDGDTQRKGNSQSNLEKRFQSQRNNTMDVEISSSKSVQLIRDKTKEFLTKNKNNFKFVRHKTMECDVWEISSVRSKENSAYSNKRLQTNNFFGPINTPNNVSRPSSMIELGTNKDKKIPILGPTRQQTEIYFKTKKSLQGLTLKGPSTETDTSKHPVQNNSTNNKVLDTATQDTSAKLRTNVNGFAGSMVTNKTKQTSSHNEGSSHDVRFLSELVKPLQHRMPTTVKEREKVITPSKHGYHPRSKSPTFKRLILATEKLQIIADRESSAGIKKKNEEAKLRNADSESLSVTNTNDEKISKSAPPKIAATDSRKKVDEWKCDWDSEDSAVSEEEGDDDDDKDSKDSFIQLFKRTKSAGKAKVDFKIAESHAELHLFLPHINVNDSQNDRLGMNSVNSLGESENSDRIYLPSISQSHNNQTTVRQDVSPARRFNKYTTARKKKRKVIVARCPSAYDPEKRVHDHLNDVNTLISIENEKCHPKEKICSFENCIYHAKLANAKH